MMQSAKKRANLDCHWTLLSDLGGDGKRHRISGGLQEVHIVHIGHSGCNLAREHAIGEPSCRSRQCSVHKVHSTGEQSATP